MQPVVEIDSGSARRENGLGAGLGEREGSGWCLVWMLRMLVTWSKNCIELIFALNVSVMKHRLERTFTGGILGPIDGGYGKRGKVANKCRGANAGRERVNHTLLLCRLWFKIPKFETVTLGPRGRLLIRRCGRRARRFHWRNPGRSAVVVWCQGGPIFDATRNRVT